ncbi:hypothetical protein KF707_10345 [Candidatus Obscuribacterales bacterium]|nr:hypothetical protein [Candidatus Obscuribacterales bacterium]MBX3136626.1 hypothetical protein [Candidatus Obscuribacterales bacterium]
MMDLGKLRGAKGKTDAPSSPSGNGSGDSRDVPSNRLKPKNITETRGFKQGVTGVGNMWSNYMAILDRYFKGMSRPDQEQLITRGCQIVTVGCAIVLTTFFYQFIPLLVRVFALPLFIVGSWFVATKVVAPIILAQFEEKLNPPE